MSNSIKKNYLYNLAYQVLAIIVPFVTTPYVSRVLGAQGIGDYSYTYGIVTYFGIFAVTGTATYGMREIAKLQHNDALRSNKFWEIFTFRLFCTLVVTAAYLFFLLNFMPEYRILYLINLLTVVSWVLDVSWYFQGIEDFKVTAVRNSLVKILGTILIFILVRTENDVWLYTLIFCITAVLGNVSMWPFLAKGIKKPCLSLKAVFSNTRPIMGLFAPVIAIQIYTVLNKTMLGSLYDIESVGYYTQADKVIQMVLVVLSSLMAVLLPRITLMFKERRHEEVNGYFRAANDYVFMLALPCIVMCIGVSEDFVPLFFGPGYESVAGLMNLLSPLFVILSLGQMFGNFLIASDNQGRYTIAVTAAAAVNFLLNILLIPLAGATGAAVATICAEAVSTGLQAWYIRDLVDLRYIAVACARYAVPSVLMGGAILLVHLTGLSSIFDMLACIVIGIAVYGAFLLVKRDVFLIRLLKRL